MDATFVRKDFYVEPPKTNASEEDWNKWLKADAVEARKAKAQFTRARNKTLAISDDQPAQATVKVNGKYRQIAVIGFVGDDEGSHHIEPVAEAIQEREVEVNAHIAMHRSAGKRLSRDRSRRAARRAAKRAKFGKAS